MKQLRDMRMNASGGTAVQLRTPHGELILVGADAVAVQAAAKRVSPGVEVCASEMQEVLVFAELSFVLTPFYSAVGWGMVLKHVSAEQRRVMFSISVGIGQTLEILCDQSLSAYEWGLRQYGRIVSHSDAGYAQPAHALRDGLVELMGLPTGKGVEV